MDEEIITDIDSTFDWGFTAVDEEELAAVAEAVQTKDAITDKCEELYAAILPLLTNLKQNPEKDYIFWPGRLAKIDAFEKHLSSIFTPPTQD